MKRTHGSIKIVLTEEEALALESDRSKWPPTWNVVRHRRKMKRLH